LKVLAILFSFLALIVLVQDFFTEEDVNANAGKQTQVLELKVPSKASIELLDSEVKWRAIIDERNKPKAPEKNTSKKVDKSTLALGNNNYRFMGVFKKDESSFVLLQTSEGKYIKLKEGDLLSSEVTLESISNEQVTFKQLDDKITYKLFERT